ncbi:MAG: phenylalanine--tRNA ligase beta subunit-related protein, partial [Candidatus Dojkabacteria bacterium]
MNIPLKWLKEYVDIPEKTRDFTDKMSMIEHMLDKIIETETDTVVDLELRGNRADCYGILGIAREAHAAYGGRFDIPQVIDMPEHDYQGFEVLVRSDTVKRFYSTVIRGVKIGPSPEWMQERLKNYGMEAINNVVDITNYVMIESGMPMHAFDLKSMRGNQLVLRPAREGEKVITFDGGELKLVPADTVFATESGEAIGLAGIVGDRSSGINDSTTDILLECANYDRSAVRKTVMRHNAWTEAGTRHSHEISSSLCDYALARAASLLLEYGNADPNVTPRIEGIHDYYPHPETPIRIEFRPGEVKRLGGVVIDTDTQKSILQRLEYKVEVLAEDKLAVTPPLLRTDVTLEADVVEDVMRIFGYENIPSTTLSSTIPDPIVLPELVIEERSRDIFTALGLDEVVLVPMSNPESLARTNDP